MVFAVAGNFAGSLISRRMIAGEGREKLKIFTRLALPIMGFIIDVIIVLGVLFLGLLIDYKVLPLSETVFYIITISGGVYGGITLALVMIKVTTLGKLWGRIRAREDNDISFAWDYAFELFLKW